VVHGAATIETDGAVEHIHELARRFLGVESYPWLQPDEQRVIVRIAPKRIGGAGPWTAQ
jgi:hypothetical protein